eukprot:3261946-Pyramimonas_sp.AAC.1
MRCTHLLEPVAGNDNQNKQKCLSGLTDALYAPKSQLKTFLSNRHLPKHSRTTSLTEPFARNNCNTTRSHNAKTETPKRELKRISRTAYISRKSLSPLHDEPPYTMDQTYRPYDRVLVTGGRNNTLGSSVCMVRLKRALVYVECAGLGVQQMVRRRSSSEYGAEAFFKRVFVDAKHKSTVVAVAELGPGLAAAHTVRHDNDTRAQVGCESPPPHYIRVLTTLSNYYKPDGSTCGRAANSLFDGSNECCTARWLGNRFSPAIGLRLAYEFLLAALEELKVAEADCVKA